MRKSDLPWILPLLQALNNGKTLQVKTHVAHDWYDWHSTELPKFDSPRGAVDYRIKPELKTPGECYYTTRYKLPPQHYQKESILIQCDINNAAIAVIKAFKAGELELPEELK